MNKPTKSDLLWEVTEARRAVLLAINLGEDYPQEATNLLAAAQRATDGGCTKAEIATAKDEA